MISPASPPERWNLSRDMNRQTAARRMPPPAFRPAARMRRKFGAAAAGGELRRGGFAAPSIEISEGWRRPKAAGTQKERHAFQRVFLFGAGNVTRTHDLLITNQLLYRLSYTSKLPLPGHLPIIHQNPRFVKCPVFAPSPYSSGANSRSRSRNVRWITEIDRQSSSVTSRLFVCVSRKSSRISATEGVPYSSTPFSKWRNILR